MRNDEQCKAELGRWLASPIVDEETKAALRGYSTEQVVDAFYASLAFGTGGLRGLMGAGTSRVNVYTVRHATQGLCNYLKEEGMAGCVAIAYDSRLNSARFAEEAACVLAANGIKAWLYNRLMPTPALSWAVRDLSCVAGICITASHNPSEYNGYKVYGADGCQITLEAAAAISRHIERADMFDDVKRLALSEGISSGRISYIGEDVLTRYIEAVKALSACKAADVPLSVVYTPLNGAGLECVTRILSETGVSDVHIVKEQALPDGNFPTCKSPNPEVKSALALGLRDSALLKPDLLLATDPDCDRIGVAVFDGEAYRPLSGDEVGVLLLDYILRAKAESGDMPDNPIAFTTIVSGDMASCVAARYGVRLERLLTGFKFIGEQIGILEAKGEAHRFVFGFEESCGYLSGAHVRDKDGVNAAMLICEMARFHKSRGFTLFEALEALYHEHGYHASRLESFEFQGMEGLAHMARAMGALRNAPPEEIGGKAVMQVIDYQRDETGLPKADVLEYRLGDGCRVVIRPSGTEPKLKAYLFARGETAANAREQIAALLGFAQGCFGDRS